MQTGTEQLSEWMVGAGSQIFTVGMEGYGEARGADQNDAGVMV